MNALWSKELSCNTLSYDKVLSIELFILCFVYIDDVVVFSKTAVKVIKCNRFILGLIRADNLKIVGLKYFFFSDTSNC